MTARTTLFLGLIGSLALVPTAALAQNCDRAVVDEAGVLGGGASRVEAAAKELESAGADVRVRVIRTFGSAGNLDNYEDALERSCRSWQAADGGTKNNLIVLIVALSDRKTGLYYGSLFKRSLESRWLAIQTDEMNPHFRDGDFAGGIAAGLREIAQVVTAKTHEYAQPVETPVQRPVEAPRPTVIQTQPTDYTGLWYVLGSIVGLAALVLLVVFAVRLKRASDRRKAAQQKAKQLKCACSAQILELTEAIPILEAKVKGLANKVSAEDGQPLLDGHAKLSRDFDNATSRFADLQNSAGDPDREGKSCEEYEQMQGSYQQVLDLLHTVRQGSEQLAAGVDGLKKAVDAAPEGVALAKSAIEAARKAAEEVEGQGYRTGEVRNGLGESRKCLEATEALLTEKRYAAAAKACGDAIRLAE